MNGHIEENEILVTELLWVDGGFKCSINELLHVLSRVGNAEPVVITDAGMREYLVSKGLVKCIENRCVIAEGSSYSCTTLYNNINRLLNHKIKSKNPKEINYVKKE